MRLQIVFERGQTTFTQARPVPGKEVLQAKELRLCIGGRRNRMRVIGHERFGVLEGMLKSGAKPLAILCIEITWVFGNWEMHHEDFPLPPPPFQSIGEALH